MPASTMSSETSCMTLASHSTEPTQIEYHVGPHCNQHAWANELRWSLASVTMLTWNYQSGQSPTMQNEEISEAKTESTDQCLQPVTGLSMESLMNTWWYDDSKVFSKVGPIKLLVPTAAALFRVVVRCPATESELRQHLLVSLPLLIIYDNKFI